MSARCWPHLNGSNGWTKVEAWVPKWMTFPPAAYTERGGVGTVAAHVKVESTEPQREAA